MVKLAMVKKIMESAGINLDEVVKQSSQIPNLLKALVEQSNKQSRALEYIIRKLDSTADKVHTIEKTIELWDRLVEEDKKEKTSQVEANPQ